MKLHEDRSAFRVLLESIHEKTGYRTDVKAMFVNAEIRKMLIKQEV